MQLMMVGAVILFPPLVNGNIGDDPSNLFNNDSR